MDKNVQIMSPIALVCVTGHHQYPGARIRGRNIEGQGDAIHDRHNDVREKKIEYRSGHDLQRRRAIGSRCYVVPCSRQRPVDDIPDIGLIFRHKYSGHAPIVLSGIHNRIN